MALDKQITIYSFDTGNLYSNKERELHNKNHKFRIERNRLKANQKQIRGQLLSLGLEEADLKKIERDKVDEVDLTIYDDDTYILIGDYINVCNLISYKGKKAKESKQKLLKLLSNKTEHNVNHPNNVNVRCIRRDTNLDISQIGIFDSSVIRTIGIEAGSLSDELIVIQVYYFDIFKDIMFNGFKFNGEKYIFFTASAGQIRTKKAVFIKEKTWNKHENTILCGLTLDKINAKGGNNSNKHLAYTALANSATDEWSEFDINKTIVVEDFETNVDGIADFIDDKDYSITRTENSFLIPHTDGAGMILPNAFGCKQKNKMIRLPWVKGLLGVFDFKKFIIQNECSPKIIDIYGVEHDVIAEDIQVIMTKSQFKMWKYYDSWSDYKEKYIKYNCQAGFANEEEEHIKNASINYQMLQTFTDFKDEDVEEVCKKSVEKLIKLCTSKENMLSAFGVTDDNKNMSYLQKSLKIYPNLMSDKFFKDKLKEIKDSMIKRFRAGKLAINGKYTFVLPDFYACCEYWFMGIENPNGLLNNGEVYCNLFTDAEKLDCLRSPHLFKEHAVRKNIAYKKVDRSKREEIGKWFNSKAIYTSCKDLITRVLQMDVDGDHLLVVKDKKIVELAEKNMQGIYTLYYDAKKANPCELNKKSIYDGLVEAFISGNIGLYSNNISKIYNSDVFINGTEEEKKEAIEVVKLLCMENNYCIDSAKTMYMPQRTPEANERIKAFTNLPLPHFFKYAKDKVDTQISSRNDCFVNKIYDYIPNIRINCSKAKIGDIDYKLLMNNPDIDFKFALDDKNKLIEEKTEKVIIDYNKITRKNYLDINFLTQLRKIDESDDTSTVKTKRRDYVYDSIKNNILAELDKYGFTREELADIFVKVQYELKPTERKEALWLCFGDIIYKNLQRNIALAEYDVFNFKKIKYVTKICSCCNTEFIVPSSKRGKNCDKCTAEIKREKAKLRKQKERQKR